MRKYFYLFKFRRCEQCGKRYLPIFSGVYQWCSTKCKDIAYDEFEAEVDSLYK